MLVVHAEFMSVQPSELLERPPYVNTGESSQFLYHLTANHMNYRCTSFRIQGTEFWGGRGGPGMKSTVSSYSKYLPVPLPLLAGTI